MEQILVNVNVFKSSPNTRPSSKSSKIDSSSDNFEHLRANLIDTTHKNSLDLNNPDSLKSYIHDTVENSIKVITADLFTRIEKLDNDLKDFISSLQNFWNSIQKRIKESDSIVRRLE